MVFVFACNRPSTYVEGSVSLRCQSHFGAFSSNKRGSENRDISGDVIHTSAREEIKTFNYN